MSNETKQNETTSTVENSAIKKKVYVDVKNLDLKNLILKTTRRYVKDNQDEILKETVTPLIDKAVAKLAPVIIKSENRADVEIKGRLHKAFKKCLFLAKQERQLFISGPAGSGKTTLGEQIANALSLNFSFISCSAGLSEAHLLGRMLFDGSYVGSDFIDTYENGGVFLFDEIDAADANTLLIINSALANGVVSVPNRKCNNRAKRHEDFICIVSGNTWGNGSFEYHGRNHLDAAFLDRFAVSKVLVDYDEGLEKEIAGEHTELAEFLWMVRKNCINKKVRKIVSTRAFISGVRQIQAGASFREFKDVFFTGWTQEEQDKATNNA